ncbi:MAG: RNase adapter RapZ [Lachnospiraceae bacterium]
MRFVIVTGMSGAGKSTALKILEDVGYFCADNLPLPLLEKFAELACTPESEYNKVALGVDIRTGKEIESLPGVLEKLAMRGFSYEILYLDAGDQALLKRFKETRRSHPLARDGRLAEGIRREREALSFLKKQSDYIIDTSALLTRELRSEMEKFLWTAGNSGTFCDGTVFGFKNGIPADADLVFDVRFLPNPYYVENLKQKTGLDPEVQEYVMGYDVAHAFLAKLEDMVEFLLPNYVAEGKNQLVIAIGCTGGHHRSVTLAEQLYVYLKGHEEYGLRIEHRDIRR